MERKKIIIGTLLLMCSPRKFSEYGTEAGIEQELKHNEQLRADHPNGPPPDMKAEWIRLNLHRARSIRNALISSLLITFSSIAIGIVTGFALKHAFGYPGSLTTNTIQVIGAGILLSATLSVLGTKIESMKGETLAEHIDRALFRWQYILGSVLFFLALSWSS